MNLAKIPGGEVYNKVPDACTLSVDIRYLPNQDKDDILEQIKGVTDDEIAVHMSGPSVKNEIDNPYIQHLVKEIKSVTGNQ
ncbi:peptidase dimerization domain-containing protein, partial [Staphylococcus equorum]|uniref:peptidase dimerization domain-containing protein n=1 Tax=Staphylococcus equorum TaxID=246432 RepID=UPI003EBB655F